MNEYEILLMLDPELSEERGEEIVARVRASVEGDGGSWDGHEPWGRRKLAYEIAHKGEGVYHLLLFTAPPATLAEISRVLKIDDGVMRHLAVRRVSDQGEDLEAGWVAQCGEPTCQLHGLRLGQRGREQRRATGIHVGGQLASRGLRHHISH